MPVVGAGWSTGPCPKVVVGVVTVVVVGVVDVGVGVDVDENANENVLGAELVVEDEEV